MSRLGQKIVGLVVIILLVAGSFTLGAYYGLGRRPAISTVDQLANKDSNQPEKVDFSIFWQTWKLLDEKYVNGNGTTTDSYVSNQQKVWGAVSGLVSSLGDPYTVFLPPEEKKFFVEDIRGNFGGVGMELGMKEGFVVVLSPLPNTPASRAGIRAGDKILKVDDKAAEGLAVDQVVRLIRGEVGQPVKLLFSRIGVDQPFELTLIRSTINIPVIKTERLTGERREVFVIHLYNFSEPSANDFRLALREFAESDTDKLIIDLRGNPGGYLEAAVDMASWFLPEGKVVVKEYHGGKTKDVVHRSRGYDVFNENLKMAILIDGGSASAAEILAGALSEYGKGVLIGEKTFGKGSVQELVDVADGASLKVTIAKWLTPKGKSISGNGLEPQIKVPFTEVDRKAGHDPQLERAIKALYEGYSS